MGTTDLPDPVVRHDQLTAVDTVGLAAALRERVDGEVRFDAGSRAAYSTDASNFRQVPIGVVVPRTPEAAADAVEVAREYSAPVLSRGGGTSLAGQCTNTAVVIGWSKYCHRMESVDTDARTCVVQPGIVLDELNRRLADTGLRFGPEPATHMNCTLGGMIGNNSCGATAQHTGKVVDNIAALEVLCYDGTRFWCGPTSDDEYAEIERHGNRRSAIYRQLRALRDHYPEQIRQRFPDIPRRVSGYNLDSLLPEHGFDVAGLLVGSESTLVTVLRAKLELVPVLRERTLVVLGYSSVDKAGDAVPKILPHEPIALEGLDAKLIRDERIKHLNPEARAEMPKGRSFLMVQFGGDTVEEADARAHRLLDDLHDTEHQSDIAVLDDPRHEDELWQVREAGLGATAHIPGEPDTFEGWEDSAVPPDRLGEYLRRLTALYEEFGYTSDTGPSLYGHFGQGCVHTRIPFDLYTADGVTAYRRFLDRAADLVVEFGGSLSGEHGDGQTRGALLPKMFGEEIVHAFGQLKAIFDPGNRMNPGKVVAPRPPDANLRLGAHWTPATPQDLYFRYPHDGGSFAEAANRCVGVGRCRQHTNTGHEVMCPSYQVTGEEEHSTRGRARLLFEMLNGHGDGPIADGWRSTDVRDALDLCLACKGCKKILTRTVRTLAPHLRDGGLVLGLEPSCTAVFRSDAMELFPEDHDVRRLHRQTVTLAELLTGLSPGYEPPTLPAGTTAIAQVHCHQHAVMGWDADEQLLEQAGVRVEHLESGCCGLAGNFGFERGHKEVSEACAERVLLPRIREASADTVVLADGFSCRTQIHELDSAGREGIHLAELLTAAAHPRTQPIDTPEHTYAQRPPAPSRLAKRAALATVALAGAGLVWWLRNR
jgi:FAD/FMN-containing dehydrogenase/ferredoxin